MRYISKIKTEFVKYIDRRGLKNKQFTIISNNCWGGFVYQKFNLSYRTPFIGLFLFASDYIKLLENFQKLIFTEVKFIDIEKSKYVDYLKKNNKVLNYPIGIIGQDIEIHFLHYKSKSEALKKWNKRVKRINFDNMLIKFSDRDLCTYELLKKFDDLSFNNKICFTSKKYADIESCITIDECKHLEYVESEWIYYEKYINIKKYLNSILK